MSRLIVSIVGLAGAVVCGMASACWAQDAALESDWVQGPKVRTRVTAAMTGLGSTAFVEIELEDGWKTYWRNPGDAGGLPPVFEWQGSDNLAEARVYYPAPSQFVDKSGTTVGYKKHVAFPIVVKRVDAAKPLVVRAQVQFGICEKVCVPVDAALEITLPPDAALPAASADMMAALELVPREQDALRVGDPRVSRFEVMLEGAKPAVVVEAVFPGRGEAGEAYLDVEGGLYIPNLTRVQVNKDGAQVFSADLGADVDVSALKGRRIAVTLVGKDGASSAGLIAK